jgi:hypothetical protein
MAIKIGEAVVSFGSYIGKDGKKYAKNRKIGDIMQHSDSRLYIAADRAFNPGAIPAKEGTDIFFIGLNIPHARLVAETPQPDEEGW